MGEEIEEARRLIEIDEVATLLHQLMLLSFDIEVGDVMNAHEYLNYEMKFDLNNPYEPTDEELRICIPHNHQKIDVDEVKVDVVARRSCRIECCWAFSKDFEEIL